MTTTVTITLTDGTTAITTDKLAEDAIQQLLTLIENGHGRFTLDYTDTGNTIARAAFGITEDHLHLNVATIGTVRVERHR